MADYVDIVAGDVSPLLVDRAAFKQVRDCALSLPPLSFAGFECRLAADQPRVDFQLNLTRTRVRFQEELLTEPVWMLLDRMVGEWVEERSDLHAHLKGIFMEFDLERPCQIPVPSLFFALQYGIESAHIVLNRVEELYPGVLDFISIAAPRLDDLPSGAVLANLGMMLGRSTHVVRARLTGLMPADVAHGGHDFAGNGWCEASALADMVDAVAILMDIVGDPPSAGLELFFDGQHPGEQRWCELLERLVDLGACSVKKRDALLEWPGAVTLPREQRPSAIRWGDRLLAGRTVSLFWRRVNHIKVTPEADGAVSAKAYLAFGHSWIDRRAAARMAENTSPCAP
jgi:hypothetical protein